MLKLLEYSNIYPLGGALSASFLGIRQLVRVPGSRGQAAGRQHINKKRWIITKNLDFVLVKMAQNIGGIWEQNKFLHFRSKFIIIRSFTPLQ